MKRSTRCSSGWSDFLFLVDKKGKIMNWNCSLHFSKFDQWFDVNLTLKLDENLTLGRYYFNFLLWMSCVGRRVPATEKIKIAVTCNFSPIVKTFDWKLIWSFWWKLVFCLIGRVTMETTLSRLATIDDISKHINFYVNDFYLTNIWSSLLKNIQLKYCFSIIIAAPTNLSTTRNRQYFWYLSNILLTSSKTANVTKYSLCH